MENTTVKEINMEDIDFSWNEITEERIDHDHTYSRLNNLSTNFRHCMKRTDDCPWMVQIMKDILAIILVKK